jgi:hypothetical protein
VYGGNFDLRNWLDEQGFHYVLAVACDEPVAFPSPRGHRREEAALVETVLPNQITWHRLSMSDGTKGPRLFDWALVPMLHRWEDDGCHGSRSSVGISPIFETSAITSCLLPWVHSFPRSSQRSAVVGILKRILSRRNRTWIAHRHIHGRNYKAVLGVTDHLTIACLEQAAAQLHAHLTAH